MFPKDETVGRKWLSALCSANFDPSGFQRSITISQRLIPQEKVSQAMQLEAIICFELSKKNVLKLNHIYQATSTLIRFRKPPFSFH